MAGEKKRHVVYQSIRRAIISHKYKSGQILNEGELSKAYGVSRTPIREALVLLAHEGFVEPMPRTGYIVTPVTIQNVLEVFHLRAILEVEAVGLAAQRVTEEDLAALEKNMQEERALNQKNLTGGRIEKGYALNKEFHLILARASGNARLAGIITQLLDEMERVLAYDPSLVDPQQHLEIVAALKQQDRSRAQEAMRKHLEEAKARILDRFEPHLSSN